jgi:Protein of unknown function (DUF3073)
MGRGRAKAKQTKVARELKYHTPNMDVDALRRELQGSESSNGLSDNDRSEDSDNDDYGEYRR